MSEGTEAGVERYSAERFAYFRILFGLYCLINYALLVPHAANLFSREGEIADPSVNWFAGYFPSPLSVFDSPFQVQIFMVAMTVLSLMLMLGVFRQFVCVLLWFGMACLFNRNNLFWSPAMPLLGWLLLGMALIPSGEPYSLYPKKNTERWFLPREVYFGAWIVLAASYSVSGLFKLASPSWVDGTAILQSLQWSWARDWWYPQMLVDGPAWMGIGITWFTLFLELLFLPLCLFKKGRFFAWAGMMGVHMNIIVLMDLFDLTFGVVIFHLFLIDPIWFTRDWWGLRDGS